MLSPPRVQNLDNYLREPAFRELVPQAVWQKAEFVRQAGNVAVHGNRMPTPETALDVLRELSHVLYWAGRTYLRKGAENLQGRILDESLIPRPDAPQSQASVAELEAVTAERDAAEDARAELEGELEALRERLAAIKAENEAVPETHDWNEEKTRRLLIDLALHRAGWRLDSNRNREYEVTGMPNESGIGYADYVLWGEDGKPLAVVEAKRLRWIQRWGSNRRSSTRTAWKLCTGSGRSSSTPTATRPGCGTTYSIRHGPWLGSTRRTN